MASEVTLTAEPRTEFGKGAARRIRRADKVPAVLYGHGTDPVHLTLPGHDLMLALKTPNALLALEIGSRRQLALPKQVQRDPIKGFIEHADLIVVRRGERVTVDVPVHVTGTAGSDTTVTLEHATVSLEVEATAIPESVEVDVEGVSAGTLIHAGDLTLPAGAVLATDTDVMIVNVAAQQSQEALDADLAGAEADLGVEREQPEVTVGAEPTAPPEADV